MGGVGGGIEVRIAGRWDGVVGEGCKEVHQFRHVVPASVLVFSCFYSPALSLSPLLPRRVSSVILWRLLKEAVFKGSNMVSTHTLHTGFPEAHLHPIHQRHFSSLYNYNETLTEDLYPTVLTI